MEMERKTYRCCSVPQCTNTSITTPNKIFIDVPRKADVRKNFLNLAGRNSEGMSITSPIYFCEDHFDLPNDMENYMRYRVMGAVDKIMLKPGCLPTKFDCQTRKRSAPTTSLSSPPVDVKIQKLAVKEEPQDENNLESTHSKDMSVEPSTTQDNSTISPETTEPTTTEPNLTEPTTATVSDINTTLIDGSGDDITPSTSSGQAPLPQVELPSDTNKFIEDYKKIQKEKAKMAKQAFKDMSKKIEANPKLYIGIKSNCYFLVNMLQTNTNIHTRDILLCLKKLRMNTTFFELADGFGITPSEAGKIFYKNIPIISKFLKPFIMQTNYGNNNDVSYIINSFEILIEKPSKSRNPKLTWSEKKYTDTIKYLISSTQNGLINYISPGYAGGLTNTQLVENCDFLELIKPGSCVLAYKGFKDIEPILTQKRCISFSKLSVGPNERITSEDALKLKKIETLRSKIKLVIRRVQRFSMLKTHSVVNSNLMSVIDECVVIACALINLQDSLEQ